MNSLWHPLYCNYLSTPFLDGEEMRKPLRNKTIEAMLKIHKTDAAQKATDLFEHALSNNKAVWAWSDQHFFHKNVIAYTDRPFQNMDEMNAHMLEKYQTKVQADDLVLFGGDLAFGSFSLAKAYLSNMPGQKILVLGNHEFAPDYRNYGFFDLVVMDFAFQYNDHSYGVSHLPVDASLLPEGWSNLHGHTHQRLIGSRHINMSIEHTGFEPIPLRDLLI